MCFGLQLFSEAVVIAVAVPEPVFQGHPGGGSVQLNPRWSVLVLEWPECCQQKRSVGTLEHDLVEGEESCFCHT